MSDSQETDPQETDPQDRTDAAPTDRIVGTGAAGAASTVTIDGAIVGLTALSIEDQTVADVLARLEPESRADAVARMLGIGARAMVGTAVGVDLAAIDERVSHTIGRAAEEAEARVRTIVAEAEAVLRASFDPDTRTSAMARALGEFEALRSELVDSIDPGRSDSHVGTLLQGMAALFGPGGELERRLTAALDPTIAGSGLAGFRNDIECRFAELRELLAERRGRRQEAQAGTRKGFEFEDRVEQVLRSVARGLGAVVERTSTTVGDVGDDIVGDFVMSFPTGFVVAVEAKHTTRITLNGSGGILAELDRAIANRSADLAICVSAEPAFPEEVGPFGVYGNRLLVVDDGDGTMLEVALRWAAQVAAVEARGAGSVDVETLAALADRIRRLAGLLIGHRRSLTDGMESINKVRDGLDDMRRELLANVDEIQFELERRDPGALRVVRTG